MTIQYKDVPRIIPENERAYFNLLEGVLNTADEHSQMEIRKNPTSYQFRIAASAPRYLNLIIQELNNLHKLLGIKLDYSKSIKSTSSVAFNISLAQ